jgi:hypothetical protein
VSGSESLPPPCSAWLPVTPTDPPRNVKVLVATMKRLDVAVAYRNEHEEWLVETCSDLTNVYPPAWWMPLPPLPNSPICVYPKGTT